MVAGRAAASGRSGAGSTGSERAGIGNNPMTNFSAASHQTTDRTAGDTHGIRRSAIQAMAAIAAPSSEAATR
ncbi:hypothetical protein D3C83_15430 [compost metagenome]